MEVLCEVWKEGVAGDGEGGDSAGPNSQPAPQAEEGMPGCTHSLCLTSSLTTNSHPFLICPRLTLLGGEGRPSTEREERKKRGEYHVVLWRKKMRGEQIHVSLVYQLTLLLILEGVQ